MADIRIKDLTTTASSTASDDFIAVDGTTNGTRKLSAFSPTFGGNATVTGTLTANGTLTATSTAGAIRVSGAGITMDTDGVGASASLRFVDGATPRFWIYKLSGDDNLYFRDMTNGRMQLQMLPGATSSNAISTFNSILSVTSTTASTSTSSGALVVGNGTSGGLGVGGAINAGSGAHVFGNAAANTTFTVSRITTSPSSIQLQAISSQALLDFTSETAAGYTWGRIASNGSEILRVHNSNLAQITNVSGGGLAIGGGLRVSAQTASTDTASGAIVVAGGVGVAGAVNAGTFYGLVDGVTAPATESGYARIYVDSADGDLKVKFGDGTVKTIATDS